MLVDGSAPATPKATAICRTRAAADPDRLPRAACSRSSIARPRELIAHASSSRSRAGAGADPIWPRARHRPGPAARSRARRWHDLPAASGGGEPLGARLGRRSRSRSRPRRAVRSRRAIASRTSRRRSGLDFRQGSFRFGMSSDYKAMMGGGVCWLDYNDDGWLDLFAVNSYSSADTAAGRRTAGCRGRRSTRTCTGRFREREPRDRTRSAGAGRRLRRSRPQRRRPHGSRRHDDDGRRPALEQRQRHVHRGCARAPDRRFRLVHGRGRRRRERRRPARPLRRRLHRPERSRCRARSPASRRTSRAFGICSI